MNIRMEWVAIGLSFLSLAISLVALLESSSVAAVPLKEPTVPSEPAPAPSAPAVKKHQSKRKKSMHWEGVT